GGRDDGGAGRGRRDERPPRGRHQARPVHAPPARRRARRDAADQGRAGPQRRDEPRQDGPVGPRGEEDALALKGAMDNCMRPEPIETTIARLGRSGYDGIEISGEPATYDADQVKGLLDEHGLACWGSVTLMTGGRDLVHEDHYVRLASVQYVKDCLSLVASLGGKILTIVPSTVGKVVPMASPEEEWEWAVQGLKECQAHAENVGVR